MSFNWKNQSKCTYLDPRYNRRNCHALILDPSGTLAQCKQNKKFRNLTRCALHEDEGKSSGYQFGTGCGRVVSTDPYDTKRCCIYLPIVENNTTTYLQCKHAHSPQESTCSIHSRYNTCITQGDTITGCAIISTDNLLHEFHQPPRHQKTSQIQHDISELSVDTIRLIDTLLTLVDDQNTLISEAISQYQSHPGNTRDVSNMSTIYQLLLC